jgi:hypothetical protein
MRFEWDERKRQANLAKHGLDFRRAVRVFDRPSFTYPSPKLDEGEMGYGWRGEWPPRGGGVDMAIRRDPRDLHEEGEA